MGEKNIVSAQQCKAPAQPGVRTDGGTIYVRIKSAAIRTEPGMSQKPPVKSAPSKELLGRPAQTRRPIRQFHNIRFSLEEPEKNR
jgi:hypothetical protein